MHLQKCRNLFLGQTELDFRLAAWYFERVKVPKASWGSTPHAFLVGRPNPSGGRREKFAQPKSGKLALVVVRRCFCGVHDSVVVG